jgi:hypothetical protein
MVWKDSHFVFGQEFKHEQREEMAQFGGEKFRPIPRFGLSSLHIFPQSPYGVSVVMLVFALFVLISVDVETTGMLLAFERNLHFFLPLLYLLLFSGSYRYTRVL